MSDDAYARKYMGGDRVLFLDKVHIPKWMHALLIGSGTVSSLIVAFAGVPEMLPLCIVPTLLTWGLLSSIRVAVTDTHVHVQYGVFGPTIALDDVVAAEVEDYKPLRYGGWGICVGLDGTWAFSVPGRGGKAVRIRYRARGAKGDVNVKDVVVSSEHAAALAAAIHEAASARATRTLADVRDDLLPTRAAGIGIGDESVAAAAAAEVELEATVDVRVKR